MHKKTASFNNYNTAYYRNCYILLFHSSHKFNILPVQRTMTAFALFDPSIDLSFAICPRRRSIRNTNNNNNKSRRSWCLGPDRQSLESTSYYQQEEEDDGVVVLGSFDEASSESMASSVASLSRSVKFADEIVSRVIPVPRYERASIGELFYSPMDVARFKRDYRRERTLVW